MSKINKKSIVYTLTILAILALAAVSLPAKVGAQYDDGYAHLDPVLNPAPYLYSVKSKSTNTLIINGRGFIPSSVAKFDGMNRPTTFIDYNHLVVNLSGSEVAMADGFFVTVFNGEPGGGYSNAVSFNMSNASLPANSYDNNNAYNANPQNSEAENSNSGDGKYSALASNAVFGSSGFLPSGLLQWILFAIIVLLIIIIVRKVMGASDRYHSEPLKHA